MGVAASILYYMHVIDSFVLFLSVFLSIDNDKNPLTTWQGSLQLQREGAMQWAWWTIHADDRFSCFPSPSPEQSMSATMLYHAALVREECTGSIHLFADGYWGKRWNANQEDGHVLSQVDMQSSKITIKWAWQFKAKIISVLSKNSSEFQRTCQMAAGIRLAIQS